MPEPATTGTGWVLVELSCTEPERVMEFIKHHAEDFNADEWKYLLSKIPEAIGPRGRLIQSDSTIRLVNDYRAQASITQPTTEPVSATNTGRTVY